MEVLISGSIAGPRFPQCGRSARRCFLHRTSAGGRSDWLNLLRTKLSFSIPNQFYPRALWLQCPMDFCSKQVATIRVPEEMNVRSAEEQSAEEYSGLRCAEGTSRRVVAAVRFHIRTNRLNNIRTAEVSPENLEPGTMCHSWATNVIKEVQGRIGCSFSGRYE